MIYLHLLMAYGLKSQSHFEPGCRTCVLCTVHAVCLWFVTLTLCMRVFQWAW